MTTIALSHHSLPTSKCYLTSAVLPSSESRAKRPYSTIRGHPFNSQVDLLLTEATYQPVKKGLDSKINNVVYHRVFMKLGDILQKDFYNNYIRQGNIILLSDGRIDIDDIFCLHDGILHMSLRKETYEKAGLVGKPARFRGRSKQRYIVEMNLRAPHMVQTKKSFKRLAWSAENVLNNGLAWLFCDLSQNAITGLPDLPTTDDLVSNLKVPTKRMEAAPTSSTSTNLLKMPTFRAPQAPDVPFELSKEYSRESFIDWSNDIHEWLALASVPADRLCSTDKIDPLLSRYTVENVQDGSSKITKVSWKGFIPADWAHELFLVLNVIVPQDEWFSMTIMGFANTPISWKGRQHSVVAGGVSGENLMTILRLPNHNLISETDAMQVSVPGDDGNMTHVKDGGTISDGTKVRNRYLSWEVVGSYDEHS